MKKLAYIILVIAVLLIISHFVKQNSVAQSPATTTTETTISVTEPTEATAAAEENAISLPAMETSIPAEDTDVVDVQEDIIIEDHAPEEYDAIDVEETNPEQTSDEDETIIE